MNFRRNKFILFSMMIMCFVSLMSFVANADTAQQEETSHFAFAVTEGPKNQKGEEVAEVSIENISGKTAKNVVFKAELPDIFVENHGKTVTFEIAELKAGESFSGQVRRFETPKNLSILPQTNELKTLSLVFIGLILLILVCFLRYRRQYFKYLFGLTIFLTGIFTSLIVQAEGAVYRHCDSTRIIANLAGKDYAFGLSAEADFEYTITNEGATEKAEANVWQINDQTSSDVILFPQQLNVAVANNGINYIAPGSFGAKTYLITGKESTEKGQTDVAYQLSFSEIDISLTQGENLVNQLRFSLKTQLDDSAEQTVGNDLSVNELATALASLTLNPNYQKNGGQAKITLAWQWVDNDATDLLVGKQVNPAEISVHFKINAIERT